MTQITRLTTHDLRFPTSAALDGSDAMNPDPDYSAAYVVLETDGEHQGHGLTFTIGRGNEVVCAAIEALRHRVVGLELDWIAEDPGRFWRHVTGDSQLRWIGPDKGAMHLATGAVVNAVWDLLAKEAGKPVWRCVADMSPEELVSIIDFRYLTDVHHARGGAGDLPPGGAGQGRAHRSPQGRGLSLLHHLGRLARLLEREADAAGARGRRGRLQPHQDEGRARSRRRHPPAARSCAAIMGPDRWLMIDANQVWEVGQAIDWVNALQTLRPLLHRGADQPRRRRGPPQDPRGDRAGEGRDRRDVPEPHPLQAVHHPRRHRHRADRRLPHRRAQRGAGGAADGGQVRAAGLAACRRRRPVRIRPAPVDDRLSRACPGPRRAG